MKVMWTSVLYSFCLLHHWTTFETTNKKWLWRFSDKTDVLTRRHTVTKKWSSSCLNDTLLHNADTQLQIKWNQMSSVLLLSVIGFHTEFGPQRPGSCSSRSARACPASERNIFFPLWIKDVRAVRTSSMLPWPGAKLCLVGCSGLVPSVSSGFMVSGFCTDTDLVVCDERWTRHISRCRAKFICSTPGCQVSAVWLTFSNECHERKRRCMRTLWHISQICQAFWIT